MVYINTSLEKYFLNEKPATSSFHPFINSFNVLGTLPGTMANKTALKDPIHLWMETDNRNIDNR